MEGLNSPNFDNLSSLDKLTLINKEIDKVEGRIGRGDPTGIHEKCEAIVEAFQALTEATGELPALKGRVTVLLENPKSNPSWVEKSADKYVAPASATPREEYDRVEASLGEAGTDALSLLRALKDPPAWVQRSSPEDIKGAVKEAITRMQDQVISSTGTARTEANEAYSSVAKALNAELEKLT